MPSSSVEKIGQRKKGDVVVLPFWQEKGKPTVACAGREVDTEFAKWFTQPVRAGDFLGKEGETLLLYRPSGKEKRILLLGLGPRKPCLPDNLRKAYAHAVKALRAKKLKTVTFFVPSNDLLASDVIAKAVFEGVLLANYSFDMLKGDSTKEENHSQLIHLCFAGVARAHSALLKKTETVTAAVNLVRDLVNGNADDVHADALVAFSRGLQEKFSTVHTTVLRTEELEKEKMGLLLAVNRGAVREPALILLEYRGNPHSKERTAVVGKGITFDTGGLNLKPTGGMETMKCDMAGAAAVLGLIQAAANLKLKTNLLAVLAVAENAIGPRSYKPGDVVRSYAGKTVEIANTDAEGRLVLADALSYIQEKYPLDRVIDLATLTGGIVVALGEEATGLFSSDEGLAKGLLKAGDRTHERLWRMPLYPEYKEILKSKIADLKNAGGRAASSCSAAAFLHQFIKNVPWAHLDIAGTAYLTEFKPYHQTYATGVGVRLLIDFFEHLNGE